MTHSDPALTLAAALNDSHQQNRFMRLAFPRNDGPAAKMMPTHLSAFEALSLDFRYEVEVVSNDAHLALKDVQGKMVTVAVLREDGSWRYFNGYVFEFRLARADGGLAHYVMVLRPWLAYLQLRHDNYAFNDLSVFDQTHSIFADYAAVADWRIEYSGDDEPMTYACQFAESDYNYVHRRWESLGWHYRWEHRADGHTLVLSDDSNRSDPIDGASPDIPWQMEAGSLQDDGIGRWEPVRRIMPARVAIASFDYKNPRPQLADLPTVSQQGDVLDQEVYEYAGYGFKDSQDGEQRVRLRMEEIESRGKHFEAAGNDRCVAPGRWFRLAGHFDHPDQDGESEFLVVSVVHEITNNYLPGVPAGYENTLTCIRRKIPWRPGSGFNSKEPKIYGPQTAIVTGPKGEEIHTDKYGRVKVQFHWDRTGGYDGGASPWLRVASAWTGNGYGFVGIPRVGQEVVVHFLDGNPDRPLVTGCLYNRDNLPAWGFPDAAHQTGIQTRSTPGGGGMSEMVIHDKAGQELINIVSQKDMNTTVLNNHATVVKGPQQMIAVTTGTQTTVVHKAITMKSETENIAFDAHTAMELSAQTEHIALQAKTAIEMNAQSQHMHLKAATDLVLEVGKSKLHMNQDGSILLEGVTITIKGSGKVDVNP